MAADYALKQEPMLLQVALHDNKCDQNVERMHMSLPHLDCFFPLPSRPSTHAYMGQIACFKHRFVSFVTGLLSVSSLNGLLQKPPSWGSLS